MRIRDLCVPLAGLVLALVIGWPAVAGTGTVNYDGPFLGPSINGVPNQAFLPGDDYTISGTANGSSILEVQIFVFDVVWGLTEEPINLDDRFGIDETKTLFPNPIIQASATCPSCGTGSSSVTFTYTNNDLAPGYYGVVTKVIDSTGLGEPQRLQTYKASF